MFLFNVIGQALKCMTCSGEDNMCENADDVGTSHVCKADEWCSKVKMESPINGYIRGCGGQELKDMFNALTDNGLHIETMCYKMVNN